MHGLNILTQIRVLVGSQSCRLAIVAQWFRAMSSNQVPVCGELVEISGLRRRGDVNGAVGKVTNARVDHAGRIEVIVFDSSGASGSSTKRIKASCLRPKAISPTSPPRLSSSSGRIEDAAGLAVSSRMQTGSSRRPLGTPLRPVSSATHLSGAGATQVRSGSSTLLGKGKGAGQSLESRRNEYSNKKAAWMQTYVPTNQEIMGHQLYHPKLTTDATQFQKDFMEAIGVPLHLAYGSETVVLMDPKLRVPCPPWAM